MTSLQKESECEKEFEKVIGCIPECANGLYEDVGCLAHGYYAIKAIKFFRGVLSNREKEIAEEVEKYAIYCQKESAEQLGMENVMLAYDMDSRQVAAKKILQILKH